MDEWRKLFKASPNQTLEYFPPSKRNENPFVSPPKEIFSEGAEDWKHSIMAQFLGKPPGFTFMQRVLTKLREKKGTVKINLVESNLFIFQFDCEEACNWVLENGPWHVQNNTMILRKWTSNLGRIEFDLCKLPLWFHLHHVPLNLYNRNRLSYIASAIDNPLYIDSITASQNRLQFAKVCVEVRAEEESPMEVEVELEDGSLTTVGVSIPWRPLVCSTCKVFGHSDKSCTKKQSVKQVWKEEKVTDPKPIDAMNDEIKDAYEVLDDNTEMVTVNDAIIVSNDVENETVSSPSDTSNVKKTPVAFARSASELLVNNPDKSAHVSIIKKPAFEARNFTPSGSNSKKSKGKWSAPGKHSITSSSNKFAALLEESAMLEDAEIEDNLENVDPSNTVWEQIIDNAKFEPKKTRAAAKGAAKVIDDMKGMKRKMVGKGVKSKVVCVFCCMETGVKDSKAQEKYLVKAGMQLLNHCSLWFEVLNLVESNYGDT